MDLYTLSEDESLKAVQFHWL